MARRDILIVPHPRLRAVSAPVGVIDDALRALLDDMVETMYAAPGIGLAGPQVGDNRRIIVVDDGSDDDPEAPRTPVKLINPEIVWSGGNKVTAEEGCLSVPGHYAEVTRPDGVQVRYQDPSGAEAEIEAEGLLARCLQHEIDHLDGVLFLDHLSLLKRDMILRKMHKAQRSGRAGDRRDA